MTVAGYFPYLSQVQEDGGGMKESSMSKKYEFEIQRTKFNYRSYPFRLANRTSPTEPHTPLMAEALAFAGQPAYAGGFTPEECKILNTIANLSGCHKCNFWLLLL